MRKIIKRLSLLLVGVMVTFIGIYNVYAASASIKVTSSTSQVVVGKEFSVTITISSSAGLGTWEFTRDYDKGKFKMVSGDASVVDYGERVKSKSYSYKFKAIGTGSGKISVKSAGARDYDSESNLGVSVTSKTVEVITQEQKKATYSKDNNLKSLSVDGLELSPAFSSGTTEYTVTADSNTEQITINAKENDSKASVSGAGTHNVVEGENKFSIIVTAQNGSTKTYNLTVNVVDPNPINVNVDGVEYVVVKRESSLTCPEGYEKNNIQINDIEVPAFYSEINNYTLVGLRSEEGISLFLYNKDKNEYVKYDEVKLDQLKLFPLEMDLNLGDDYKKSSITINDKKFLSLRRGNSKYSIIHARNLETGKDNYYTYDSDTNAAIIYTDEDIKPLQEKLEKSMKIILALAAETVIVVIVLICVLISKAKYKKKYTLKIKEELSKEKKLNVEPPKEEPKKEEPKEEPKVELKKEEPKEVKKEKTEKIKTPVEEPKDKKDALEELVNEDTVEIETVKKEKKKKKN